MATFTQLVRFGVVGIASNAVLYGAYLLLTAVGIPPKVAMTLLYAIGVAQTFFANRAWTFAASRDRGQFARYCTAYAMGYLFQFAGLSLLVDGIGLPHQPVQGVLILCTAALLFALQKLWVFRRTI